MKNLLTIICLMLLAGPVFGQQVKHKNYSGLTTPTLTTGITYYQCNFSMPNAKLDGKYVGYDMPMIDDKPTTFIECNLVNRKVRPTTDTLVRCNTTIRRSAVKGITYEVGVWDGKTTKTIKLARYNDIIYGNHKKVFPSPKIIETDPPDGTDDARKLEIIQAMQTKEDEVIEERKKIAPVAELGVVRP